MLFDTYTKKLPDNCPSCNCVWKSYNNIRTEYPMIGVLLKGCIDVTCSNPKCRANTVYNIVKKNEGTNQ